MGNSKSATQSTIKSVTKSDTTNQTTITQPNPYRILLIGMPSSGRRSIMRYFKTEMKITNVNVSNAANYQELSFIFNQKSFKIIMETLGAFSTVKGNYYDPLLPLSSPYNGLHAIIFVIDANNYNDNTYDSMHYEDLRQYPDFLNFTWEGRMFSDQLKFESEIVQNFANSKLFVHEVIQSVLSYKLAFEIPFLIYANKRDLSNAFSAKAMENIKHNLITSNNLSLLKNTLFNGIPMDVINVIVEYLPGITDEAIQRPFKVFDSIAVRTPKNGAKFVDKKKYNRIEKGFVWLTEKIKLRSL